MEGSADLISNQSTSKNSEIEHPQCQAPPAALSCHLMLPPWISGWKCRMRKFECRAYVNLLPAEGGGQEARNAHSCLTSDLGITIGITMKTVTIKISEELDGRLRRLARKRKESFSELARRALAREVEEERSTFAEQAAAYKGMFAGEPDLSGREGYGRRNDR
jgi:predicted transcriptional regulator